MPLLAARGMTRRFGAFVALENVDFAVSGGEVHALLGENGAGKSTLMNVLSGGLRPTSGEILRDGVPLRFASPADARRRGVGMVHQHFVLVPTLSVRENLLLGASAAFGGPFSYPVRTVLDEATAIAARLGWDVPWDEKAGDLPVGTQQRVEILKALRGETRVLIFDEPTAVLTPTETPELFATIRRLAGEGRGIVFISHKLDEALTLADDVTVLRRGKVVHRTRAANTDAATLARAMVGEGKSHACVAAGVRAAAEGKGSLLRVEQLTVGGAGRASRSRLDSLSFDVAAGEIFGVAGVDGNGQAELAECLAGLLRPDAGRILVGGAELVSDPAAFRRAGVAVIPADRQTRGLALPLSLTENFALGMQDEPAFRRGPILLWPRLRARADELIQEFDVRVSGGGAGARAGSLSGGNQQKVVIARALSQKPRMVVAVNPTRGLDVGAIAFVHAALRRAQNGGAAVVLISTELDEVAALSTKRVAVLFAGRFAGIVPPSAGRETFGLLMGGGKSEAKS